ncbi:hypothetical protein V8J88_03850 [Massilia sp. W12]|uniref:hypothetical protein n=1 Tax=Massilia sp. W12 TaxID=3126507 RepID=UPI0030CC270E
MFYCGTGTLFGTQLTDANGTSVAIPTPAQVGIVQDVTVDIQFEVKFAYGRGQFPVSAMRGKGQIEMKAKAMNFSLLTLNALVFGQTVANGQQIVVIDDIGAVAQASTTVTPPAGGTYVANVGVRSSVNGTPWQRVSATPAPGQYATNGTGQFTFNAADVGRTLFFDYIYSVGTGRSMAVRNVIVGATPTFRIDFGGMFEGQHFTISFPRVTSKKLSIGTKLDDYAQYDLDLAAMPDANGILFSWSGAE